VAVQHFTTIRAVESLLDTLNVRVGNCPAAANENAEVFFGAPSANGLRVAINATCGGSGARGLGSAMAASFGGFKGA
jgi:hypothetical protein